MNAAWSSYFVLALAFTPGCSQPDVGAAHEPPSRSATAASPIAAAVKPEATWKHPGMAMRFSYPDALLKVAMKPDGATLTSEVLGTIEDRSDQGKDRPGAFTIRISVRVGEILAVMKTDGSIPVATLFPGGTEASFVEQKDYAERVEIAGRRGYRVQMGSHELHTDVVYAPLPSGRTLEVVCDYLGEMARPKVPFATQKQACERVIATLSVGP